MKENNRSKAGLHLESRYPDRAHDLRRTDKHVCRVAQLCIIYKYRAVNIIRIINCTMCVWNFAKLGQNHDLADVVHALGGEQDIHCWSKWSHPLSRLESIFDHLFSFDILGTPHILPLGLHLQLLALQFPRNAGHHWLHNQALSAVYCLTDLSPLWQ